jgi:hypothetical protein
MRRAEEKTKNDQTWSVGIVIPAHNEERLVARCLRSVLALQLDIPSWIVLVADRCSDKTGTIGEHILQGRGEVVNSLAGNVGAARDLGSRAAVGHLQHRYPTSRIWLANTDADGFVPSSWIDRQLVAAENGIHALAGVVDLDDGFHTSAAFNSAFRTSYGDAQCGQHPHVQGANLGLCAAALEKVGGWESIANGEDRELWDRLGEFDFRRASDAAFRVTTSSRLDGRVAGGFSHSLRLLVDESEQLAS